jgi:hypothetical protein
MSNATLKAQQFSLNGIYQQALITTHWSLHRESFPEASHFAYEWLANAARSLDNGDTW